MSDIQRYDNYGIVDNGNDVYTFKVGNTSNFTSPLDELFNNANIGNRNLFDNFTLRVGDYNVLPYGKENNNLPLEIRENVGKNRILPELLEKQIRYLIGKGPVLYRELFKDGKKVREYVENTEILNWLQSWKKLGAKEDYISYLINIIRDFYYTEGVFSKYIFNKSRRISGKIPVRALEHVSVNIARFATTETITFGSLIEDYMFNKVIVGNWLNPNITKLKIYNKLDESNPFASANVINYQKSSSFGENLYSYPSYYYGLKEWIIGSNLNPKYINSFLKNSLNAKLHILIPYSWVKAKEERLKSVCEQNQERQARNKPIVEKYDGVTVGLSYNEGMLNKLINTYLEKITTLMSGEGKNQGKLFSTWKMRSEYGIEEWEFKEIPTKYKEFVDSIIKYDARSDQVILSGKGLDASISNVSKEGVISKSGSDTYYNYLLYLSQLYIPEFICTYDINLAIKLNFPGTDLKLGFFQHIPAKQEETPPANRLQNNINE